MGPPPKAPAADGEAESKHARDGDDAKATSGAGAGTGAGSDGAGKRVKPSLPAGAREKMFEGLPLVVSRDKVVYDLYGVVNHFGALGAGHYVAYGINPSDNKWHCFNDRVCADMEASSVQSPAAYMLFYVRRDMKGKSVTDLFPRSGIEKVDVSNIGRRGLRERMAERCNIM